jgi:hypothetical protein
VLQGGRDDGNIAPAGQDAAGKGPKMVLIDVRLNVCFGSKADIPRVEEPLRRLRLDVYHEQSLDSSPVV